MARFSPPGNLTDLTNATHLQEWSDTISGMVDGLVQPGGQFFNPITHPRSGLQERPIPWLSIPQTVADWKPVEVMRIQVDDPANRRDAGDGQNEYTEWFTRRDPAGVVLSVDVTTELPEYWAFIGRKLTRNQLGNVVRQLYPAALDDELFTSAGVYNPLNRWNTTDGALHLIGQINTLPAAMGVIGNGVPWRFSPSGQVVDVQDCGLGVFHADTALVSNINRLAREGRALTLRNPAGIYIVGIDTAGWVTPDASDPAALVTYSRGTPPMHARVAPPAGATYRLGDVTIAGEPIRWGSQIAERTVVAVSMAVGPAGEFSFASGIVCGAAALIAAPGAATTGPAAAAGARAAAAATRRRTPARPAKPSHIIFERSIDG